jgi:hypothetical protein
MLHVYDADPKRPRSRPAQIRHALVAITMQLDSLPLPDAWKVLALAIRDQKRRAKAATRAGRNV